MASEAEQVPGNCVPSFLVAYTVVPRLSGTRDQFCGRQCFYRLGMGGWFRDDASAFRLWCTVFLLSLHQLHLRSSGIRSWRLGTPALQGGQPQSWTSQVRCGMTGPNLSRWHLSGCLWSHAADPKKQPTYRFEPYENGKDKAIFEGLISSPRFGEEPLSPQTWTEQVYMKTLTCHGEGRALTGADHVCEWRCPKSHYVFNAG